MLGLAHGLQLLVIANKDQILRLTANRLYGTYFVKLSSFIKNDVFCVVAFKMMRNSQNKLSTVLVLSFPLVEILVC